MGLEKAESVGEMSASRSELGRKLIISGRTGPCATSPMSNVSLLAVLPSVLVRSLHQALARVSRGQLLHMEGLAKASVPRSGVEGFGQSG